MHHGRAPFGHHDRLHLFRVLAKLWYHVVAITCVKACLLWQCMTLDLWTLIAVIVVGLIVHGVLGQGLGVSKSGFQGQPRQCRR